MVKNNLFGADQNQPDSLQIFWLEKCVSICRNQNETTTSLYDLSEMRRLMPIENVSNVVLFWRR